MSISEISLFKHSCDTYLRMSNNTDRLAVTQHLPEVIVDGFLSELVCPLLVGLGESLLLALVPEIDTMTLWLMVLWRFIPSDGSTMQLKTCRKKTSSYQYRTSGDFQSNHANHFFE